MAYTFEERESLIIRMTTADRQAINRIIQHKRQEFESKIKRGVVAMLNAQEERDRLADKRSDYMSFLSTKTQRQKADLRQLTAEARDIARDAPMGIGAGANIVLTGANKVGQAILDEGQYRREEKEAQQNLYSAQMLYYIPPQDYEPIAERVAQILSYRYQFLIFRLAAGENGYIRLANFFIKSMKSHAISCLREQKNNVIGALINAATPPSTDVLSYHDYTYFSFILKIWGGRATLALDEDANKIVDRCGPAVRVFLGGCRTYANLSALKVKNYNGYTILGMLNHAPILNGSGRVMAGLTSSQAQSVSLYGNMKYPMILLSQNETTAHLGVNFATRMTDYILESDHQVVLKRLVPNFSSYHSPYQLTDEIDKHPDNFDAHRYAEERLECPWTTSREEQLQTRLLKMYGSETAQTDLGIRDKIDGNASVEVMWKVGHEDVLALQHQDIQDSTQALLRQVSTLFEHDIKKEKIHALNLAKHSAKTATQTLKYMLSANTMDGLSDVKHLVELVNLCIYACRSNLMQEAGCLEQVLTAKEAAKAAATPIAMAYQLAMISMTSLIELLGGDDSAHDDTDEEFVERELSSPPDFKRLESKKRDSILEVKDEQDIEHDKKKSTRDVLKSLKTQVRDSVIDEKDEEHIKREMKFYQSMFRNLKTQVRDNISSINTMIEVGEMIACYDTEYANTGTDISGAIFRFEEEVNRFRQSHQIRQLALDDMGSFFTEILFDARFYRNELKDALEHHSCVFIEDPSWTTGLDLVNQTLSAKMAIIKAEIETWFAELEGLCQTAQTALNGRTWRTNRRQLTSQLDALKQEAIQRRDKIIAVYNALSYPDIVAFKDTIHAYFLRAKHQDKFSSLYSLAAMSGCNMQALRHAARALYFSYYQAGAQSVKTQGEAVIRQYASIPNDISWQELTERAMIVREAKERLELEVRDDVELLELASSQLSLLYREAFQRKQDIADIGVRIVYFHDNYDVAAAKPKQQNYLQIIMQKVNVVLDRIRTLGILSREMEEHLAKDISKFESKWNENRLPHTHVEGIKFLAKLLIWIQREYCRQACLDEALRNIETENNRVSLLLRQEPLEFLNGRKQALRAVKQAYAYIQKVNERMIQNELGIGLPVAVNDSDLVKDILIWSRRLNLAERQWQDARRIPSRQLQQRSCDYKTPLRKLHSFLLAVVLQRIKHISNEREQVRHIRDSAQNMRLRETGIAPEVLAQQLEDMRDRQQVLLYACMEKLKQLEMQQEELSILKNRIFSLSLKLFFTEWKRKAFNLPLESLDFKKKIQSRLAGKETEQDVLARQNMLDESSEPETSVSNLEDMLELLKQPDLGMMPGSKSPDLKLSTVSMFRSFQAVPDEKSRKVSYARPSQSSPPYFAQDSNSRNVSMVRRSSHSYEIGDGVEVESDPRSVDSRQLRTGTNL